MINAAAQGSRGSAARPIGLSTERQANHALIRKRVLFITHVGEAGGAEYKMVDLCRALNQAAEVMLLEHGSLEKMLSAYDIKCTVQPMPAPTRKVQKDGRSVGVVKAIPGALSMARHIGRKAREFDVVVCFSQKAFVLASLAKPIMRRPIIWFMNDILSASHFNKSLIRFLVLLSRFSADHIILNSQASLADWVAASGRSRRVSVIYPGIRADQVATQLGASRQIAAYQQTYKPNNERLIGMFGRIGRWKGQEVFIRAIALVPEVRAIIVGRALFAEEDYERRMRELAVALGLRERIHFIGHVDDVLTLMAACDVVAHCSTAPEPFGLVIAEAMLAGTPVVASDAGGPCEIVIAGETGQLTPLKDHRALAAAIQRYLENPEWSQAVARRAKVRAQEMFSEVAMTKAFMEVLEKL